MYVCMYVSTYIYMTYIYLYIYRRLFAFFKSHGHGDQRPGVDSRYSVYWLCWYKSTNTGTKVQILTRLRAVPSVADFAAALYSDKKRQKIKRGGKSERQSRRRCALRRQEIKMESKNLKLKNQGRVFAAVSSTSPALYEDKK